MPSNGLVVEASAFWRRNVCFEAVPGLNSEETDMYNSIQR